MNTKGRYVSFFIVAAAGLAIVAGGQLGQLQPPPGPVTATGTSLDAIEAKLEELSMAQGPWETKHVWVGSKFVGNAELVLEGPVFVHSVHTYGMGVWAFDGPGGAILGSTNGTTGEPLSGDMIFLSEGEDRVVDTIVQGGLYLSIKSSSVGAYTVAYRTIP